MTNLAPAYPMLSDTLADIRNVTNHPLQLAYGEVLSECLLLGRLEDARVPPFFRLTEAPFTGAVRSAVDQDDREAALGAGLTSFYAEFQPASPAEWFRLPQSGSNARLRHEPVWASVPPWRARSVESYRDAIAAGTLGDNRKNGFDSPIQVSGWAGCGPVSRSKCHAEARRLSELVLSLEKNGYKRHEGRDGDITATALVAENLEWRWVVTNGVHRASVVAALGFPEIPVRINLVVRRSESAFWPHVCGKLYTENEALQIFDNMFAGRAFDVYAAGGDLDQSAQDIKPEAE